MAKLKNSRIVEVADERRQIIKGPDGFYVYWPNDGQSALRASDLRSLAAELDKRNREWGRVLTEAHKRGEI